MQVIQSPLLGGVTTDLTAVGISLDAPITSISADLEAGNQILGDLTTTAAGTGDPSFGATDRRRKPWSYRKWMQWLDTPEN